MTYELTDNDRKIVTELESGGPDGIRDAAQQMSRMQNNEEWQAIQAQFRTDKGANGSLPNIDFGPDGSMVIHGVAGLPEGDRFDGPMTAKQSGSDPGIEHQPSSTQTQTDGKNVPSALLGHNVMPPKGPPHKA